MEMEMEMEQHAQPSAAAAASAARRAGRTYVQAKRRGGASAARPAKKRSGVFAGMVLSATHLDTTQRARLEEVVRLMGGELSGTFDRTMHALIAGGVGSDKYIAAKRWGVPVVDAAWVEACFRAGEVVNVENYETPIFHKLRFSVTGWSDNIPVKNEIIDLISINGGNFAASMRPDATTHLVAESFVGPKCEATLTFTNIDVVSEEWVRECVAAGAYVPVEDHHRVKSEVIEDRRAQQRKEKQALRRKREREIAEEREKEEARQAALEALMEAERDALDTSQRAETQLTLWSHFTVFMHGFDPKRWRTVQAILSRTGATVLWEWNPTATHVVVGDRPNADYLDMLRKLHPDLEEITSRDIMACLQDGTIPARKRRRCGDAKQDENRRGNSREPARDSADAKGPEAKNPDRQEPRAAEATAPAAARAALPPLAPSASATRSARFRNGPTRLRPKKVLSFDYAKALICVSRYVGAERQRVETLAKELGARFTDRLTRRNPAVTLLISLDLTGPKCTKAREWGIPVYSLEWLEGEAKTKKANQASAPA